MNARLMTEAHPRACCWARRRQRPQLGSVSPSLRLGRSWQDLQAAEREQRAGSNRPGQRGQEDF